MENQDIGKLRKILKYKERMDLADLLKSSHSVLNESSYYGSRAFSTLSVFEIYSPIKLYDKLTQLSEKDLQEIYNALLLIYPAKDGETEIINIEYYPDFDLKDETQLVDTYNLKRLDFEYIQDQIKKCNDKIIEKDFDGAVTNSRALLESICLFIYESKEDVYDYKGNLLKLYKDVSKILNMTPSDYANDFIKQILSGVFSIINGISGLRNDFSDAHGSSPSKTYKIDARHAILTVNLSKSIAEYLFLSFEKSEKSTIA
ncbi:MAG TPA: abortive infection family protein [Edaphocola sp.]|nr:abortive infection family protein [Edaphocola sp.]